MAILTAEHLEVQRGAFRLVVPALAFEPGEVVGVVGHNGAGKTTLLQACAGLLAPTAGSVRVLGMAPTEDVVAFRRQVGWMSDDMPLFPLSLAAHARFLSRFYPTWDAGLAADLFARFGLDPTANVARLSKGEGTRVRLVYTLAFRPRVLFLDEPATGLDVPGRRALLGEILDVMRDEGRCVVVSSHQVDDIERIADRLVVLDHGRVVHDGDVGAFTGGGETLSEALSAGSGGGAGGDAQHGGRS